jgi:LacI family transcriptional regulator
MAATPSRANLADVARRAGVSLSTASRVVSDNGYPVAEATRRRVLEAVRELSYSPSVLARALVTKRTHIVGVIVGDVEDPYFAEIVRGVEDVARRAGYLVIVCNADRDPKTELGYLRTLLDYRADGVILAGGGVVDKEYELPLRHVVTRLERQGTIVVALAKVMAPVPCITIDNRAPAAAMARHLLDLGHRRIGVVAGPGNITTAQVRLQGVRDALGPRGLPASMVADGGFTVGGGERAATRLLDRVRPPTAIFALNDQMAIGALTAARRLGLEIPGDVTIVGFGDTTAARQAWPPLTTVSVPRHEMGAAAMEGLLDQLNGGRPLVSRLLECSLVVRASGGPPRARREAEAG